MQEVIDHLSHDTPRRAHGQRKCAIHQLEFKAQAFVSLVGDADFICIPMLIRLQHVDRNHYYCVNARVKGVEELAAFGEGGSGVRVLEKVWNEEAVDPKGVERHWSQQGHAPGQCIVLCKAVVGFFVSRGQEIGRGVLYQAGVDFIVSRLQTPHTCWCKIDAFDPHAFTILNNRIV